MYNQPKECPHCKATGKFFIKKGYFRNKCDHQPVPRYKCKACGKNFSSHTILPTYRQKKPYLNHLIYKLYASATTQRRLARVLGCNLKTLARKLLFIAEQARIYHEEHISNGGIQTTFVQFDEMETFEHTRLKPLSIAMAVRAKFTSQNTSNTNEIIDFRIATMNCHGHLSALARHLYGIRPDTRSQACKEVFETVAKCQKPGYQITVATDGKKSYPAILASVMPSAIHQPAPNRIAAAGGNNPLFSFNSIAGKIRHDLSRMARRSWVTTKTIWGLEAHLMLYVAWNNNYPLFKHKNGLVS